MSAYFDASALATIVFRDHGWEMIAAWLSDRDDAPWYSDFGRGEMYSALGNNVRRGDVTVDYARAVVAKSRTYLDSWMSVEVNSQDIADATDMLVDFTLALRLPDAIHIATARRLDLLLISTDAQQVRAAGTLGIAARNPLEHDETRI